MSDVRSRYAAGMECSHSKLRARFPDRLGGNNADRLADLDRLMVAQIQAIALAANAIERLACDRRTDFHLDHFRFFDRGGDAFSDNLPRTREYFVPCFHVFKNGPGKELAREYLAKIFPVFSHDLHSFLCPAIFLPNDQILRDIYQAARKIPGLRGL